MLQGLVLNLVRPVLVKVLAGLGIGIITYLGADALISNLIADLKNSLLGMPPQILQIVSLFGVIKAFSIILGAFTTALSIQTFKKFGIL